MTETMTFTQALQRLEEIVQLLERPDVELEQGLQLLEEGVKLHAFCQATLQQTQTKITELLAKPAEAGPAVASAAKPTPASSQDHGGDSRDAAPAPLFEQDEGLPF